MGQTDMRINFVTSHVGLAGGIRVVATYAQLFEARGHQVTWISTPAFRAHTRAQSVLVRLGLRAPNPPVPIADFADFLGERHIQIEAERPITAADVPDGDLIIATWWETAEWVNAMPATKGRKAYLMQDYEVFPHLSKERVGATYGFDMQKIAVSEYIRGEVIKNHDVSGEIAVVPNSVDLKQFTAPARQKTDGLTVGFMYTPVPRKNIGLAIEAVTRFRERYPNLRVRAFGSTDPAGALPDWVDYTRQPDQATLPRIYAECDVWLFPTRNEGFGLPLLESMACRTPVLATDAGAAPQLVTGQNGRILPHDPEAFVAAMTDFADMDNATWQAMSQAAFDTAHGYTWDDAAERFLMAVGQDR